MLDWFEKNAPIKTKFKVLSAVYSSLSGATLLAISWVAVGGGIVPSLAIAAICFVSTVLVSLISATLICKPYVATVVRMEGLAAGDLAGAIHYSDHLDCVGRMTRAMAVFRENAIAVQCQTAFKRDPRSASKRDPLFR